MKHRDLSAWLEYIQGLHVRSIDLSLERVKEIYRKLYPQGIEAKVITIAGTNGKGSSAELIASIYATAGYSVGKYTSPHLVEFNERFEINRAPVSDESLILAFEQVERARQSVPLTFFEFATLIAIYLFAEAKLDVMVMEVGLGGRLDAVNILDSDIALITNISIDHSSWLGDTVEQIALEKAGIARPQRPVIIASDNAPANLYEYLLKLGALTYVKDINFYLTDHKKTNDWSWQSADILLDNLPMPFGQSGVQLDNAAGVLMLIDVMQAVLEVEPRAITAGIEAASLVGRCQLAERQPMLILDVSHNEASLKRLAKFIRQQQKQGLEGKCIAVCGMLRDKEVANSLRHMKGIVDSWYLATIHHERGSSAEELQTYLSDQQQTACFDHVEMAYEAAKKVVKKCDCLVVFGSFHIVGDIIKHRRKSY